jgi:hypothetical protein
LLDIIFDLCAANCVSVRAPVTIAPFSFGTCYRHRSRSSFGLKYYRRTAHDGGHCFLCQQQQQAFRLFPII